MTERIGGSDVGQTETVAQRDGDTWRLYGTKWFTSATTADMALTLARPEGNPPGGRGLAMFYLELRDENGRLQNLHINRLKDKFGTRKLPTAELTLDGVVATPVAGLENGGIGEFTLTSHQFLSSGVFRSVFIASHRDFCGLSVVTLRKVQKNRVRR